MRLVSTTQPQKSAPFSAGLIFAITALVVILVLPNPEGLPITGQRMLAVFLFAVVVISSYLPEVLSISDRVLVARLGRIVAEFDAASATEDKIMYAAIH